MFVQPMIGYYRDNYTFRFGHRRPFIAAEAVLVAIAVILIGFAADIGHICGDLLGQSSKPWAIAVFIVGFAVLDIANNMLQGPCRALLADLSGGNWQRMQDVDIICRIFFLHGSCECVGLRSQFIQ